MGKLAVIGDRFEKEERQVEKDLLGYLKSFQSGSVISLDSDYKRILKKTLEDKGFIENYDHFTYVITSNGITAIKRGWVIRDFQPIEKEEKRIKVRDYINLFIALCGVLVGALGLIFPRQEIPQRKPEHIEVVVMARDTVMNTSTQIDEIAQATDSTKQKNCNNDK